MLRSPIRSVVRPTVRALTDFAPRDKFDPARLFQTAGRVGVCYTSDTGGVSWDDLIAENMRALGPELVTNGTFDDGLAGWAPLSGAVLSSTSGVLSISGNGVNSFPSARQTVTDSVLPAWWY